MQYFSLHQSKQIKPTGWKSKINITRPCLLAVYATPATAPLTPALLDTLMILPDFCSFMTFTALRIRRTGAVRFTAITRSQSSSRRVSTELFISRIPATFIRMSRWPPKTEEEVDTIRVGASGSSRFILQKKNLSFWMSGASEISTPRTEHPAESKV